MVDGGLNHLIKRFKQHKDNEEVLGYILHDRFFYLVCHRIYSTLNSLWYNYYLGRYEKSLQAALGYRPQTESRNVRFGRDSQKRGWWRAFLPAPPKSLGFSNKTEFKN